MSGSKIATAEDSGSGEAEQTMHHNMLGVVSIIQLLSLAKHRCSLSLPSVLAHCIIVASAAQTQCPGSALCND
eukprot:scaffold419480_cov28-Prasinocladus_malaysianus.AAC.1